MNARKCAFLAVAGLGVAVKAQVAPVEIPDLPPDPLAEARIEPTTTYVETQMPILPWLGADSPEVPEWADPRPGSAGPFIQPGLGTPSIGGSSLPPVMGGRPRGAPVRLGPVDLWPRLSYDLTYGDGLLTGPGQEEETWLNTVTPVLAFAAGDHWTLTYIPSIRFFSADGYDNTVNHTLSLGWRTVWKNWAFRMDHASALTSDPLIETATQTDQTTHTTGLGATYDLGNRGAFDFSLRQSLRFASEFTDTYSWSSQNWYDYPWRPKLRVGLGVGFGYDSVEPGTDMSNQRLNVRLTGNLGEKVTFEVGGGGEWREFYGADADTALNPLVNVRVAYQVLEKTSVSIGFSRDVNVSYFEDEYTENTSIQGGLVQVLGDRWTASATGGFRFSRYQQATQAAATTREDGSSFARVALQGRITSRISAVLSYNYSANDSDQGNFSYDSQQVSLGLDWSL